MCDACTRLMNRRTLLRGAVLGGTAVATSSLWLPGFAHAADTNDDTLENAAMAEDRPTLAPHPSVATSSGSVQVAVSPAPAAATGASSAAAPTTLTSVGTRAIPSINVNAISAPPILTRAQWGADEAIRLDDRLYAPVRKLIVHHTASANKPSDPASVVRFVEKYHASGRGFSDTGYNFLIDHKGVIYEGRAARQYTAGAPITGADNKGWGVVGAHAKGFNAGSCGVCLIGDFDTATPTDAALSSLVWLLSWQASRNRIDAKGTEEYIDMYGGHHVFPNISGHRQVGQTLCPGTRLFKLLPTIRDSVAARAGTWSPLLVDIPGVLRHESGALRSASAASTVTASASATDVTTTPGTGTKLTGIRVVSTGGTIYTAGKARKLGNPSTNGVTDVVALANTVAGDGYWALGSNGKVAAFGGLPLFGDTSGKPTAADIVATPSGGGYWILTAEGGIYPFGDAGYASSPKKAGLGGTSLRMIVRPQADGYWVLMSDGTVRAFGAAPKLGSPTDAGAPVDLCATPSGKGYWVLTDAGRVVPFGDAVDKGDLKRSKISWKKKVVHILGTPSGKGYVIINSEGSMLAFGDAPVLASFGGSGMTVGGVASAFG